MRIRKTRTINTVLGAYHRAVETDKFIFYVNYEESDENAQVIMYDRNRNLISNNYFASEALYQEVTRRGRNKKITWMSEKMKKSLRKSK